MDLLLNEFGDLAVPSTGVIRLTSGTPEIAKQQLAIQLRTFLGEWFLDTSVGVPYFRDILVKNPNELLLRTLFRRKILDNVYVVDVPRLDLALDNESRTLSVDFDALLIDGTIVTVAVTPIAEETPPVGLSDPYPVLF